MLTSTDGPSGGRSLDVEFSDLHPHQRERSRRTLFGTLLPKLRRLVEVDWERAEEALGKAGAPWTSERDVPEWQPE